MAPALLSQLLQLYLAAGAVGGAAQCWWQPQLNLGASGSVNAVVIFSTLLNPYATYLVYGIVPAPAWLLAILWLGYDFWGAARVRCPPTMPRRRASVLSGSLANLLRIEPTECSAHRRALVALALRATSAAPRRAHSPTQPSRPESGDPSRASSGWSLIGPEMHGALRRGVTLL